MVISALLGDMAFLESVLKHDSRAVKRRFLGRHCLCASEGACCADESSSPLSSSLFAPIQIAWSCFTGNCQRDSKVRSHQKYARIPSSVTGTCRGAEYNDLPYGSQVQLSVLGFLWGACMDTRIRTEIFQSSLACSVYKLPSAGAGDILQHFTKSRTES